ncbi:LOW QUALITY PROTEIN: signal recognition particle receptor subunit beta [Nilaparvata lugens]|uniref:LOW QUALITY PROTEIN: signal recognition particle receptor subunit beta n=1 Tax=Nilaparvata lugens TaxID=108931 RepID=UPI00193EB159|nr:LOW QUALITY PROTEIN: signal recognition particle receptor subunit beta [Nilaparvata lugens]
MAVFFAIWKRSRSVKNCILITGLCDSGKTLIYSHLLHSKYVGTHTSIKENIGDYVVKNRALRLIDIPGHERLRGRYIDAYKGLARGVIFVVDSVTLQKEIRDAAEFLYTLLLDPVLLKAKPQLLILCNKQDQTMAKAANVVKSLLEKELNVLKVTKTNQLTSIEGSSNTAYLGSAGKDFDFTQSTIPVDFAECCAFRKDENTEPELKVSQNGLKALFE